MSESTADPVPVIKDSLRQLVRYAALSRLRNHADCQDVALAEMDHDFRPGRILASNMVFILASGESARVTFKVHFNCEVARHLAFRVFGGESADAISFKRAVDYFKEYCNLVAGSVIAFFEQVDIAMGISLPHATRGFYEIFADYQEQQRPIITYSDFWALRVNGHTVYCSALLEILNVQQLEKLIGFEIAESDDSDAEMDFL